MSDPKQQPFLQQFFYHLSMGLLCQPKQVPMTPLRMATEQFEEAQMDLLNHAHLAEYHNGMVNMLETRIGRLRTDMSKLAKPEEES